LARRDLGGLTDSRNNGSALPGLFASVIATRFEKHSETTLLSSNSLRPEIRLRLDESVS
jgi:hypothetical protein